MKAVIFTGGNGSHALQRGLKKFNCDLTLLINAWDDGKSTGFCRSILETLGPSDVRKNHFHLWTLQNDSRRLWVPALFSARVHWPLKDLLTLADAYLRPLKMTADLRDSFFQSFVFFYEESQIKLGHTFSETTLEDFSLVNILYAADFVRLGAARAIRLWEQRLGLTDQVILASETHTYLNAKTQLGRILRSEAEIVDFHFPNDRLVDVNFENQPELNPQCESVILNADLLFFAPGTWFSSLYPTLKIPGLGAIIQKSSARKYMFSNNSVDRDFQGWTVSDFVEQMAHHVPLSDFTFVENLRSVSELQFSPQFKKQYNHLGQNFQILENGRHDAQELAHFVESEGLTAL